MVFTLSIATTSFWAYGPLILKVLFATNPLFSGYALAGEALAWSLATMAVSAAPVSADKPLVRIGTVAVSIVVAGFAWAVPAGSLGGIVLCSLLQGVGFGLFWPAVVHRLVRYSVDGEVREGTSDVDESMLVVPTYSRRPAACAAATSHSTASVIARSSRAARRALEYTDPVNGMANSDRRRRMSFCSTATPSASNTRS